MADSVAVAFVIDALDRGGAERIAVSLANELDPQRFHAYMITTRRPGDLAADLAPHVHVYSLDRRSRWDIQAIYRFARFIEQHDIRIVHTHNHTSAYFARIARFLIHGHWIQVMHDHYGPIKSTTWLQLLDRLLLPGVDYYFGVSEALVHYAIKDVHLPPLRCEFLANGIVVPPVLQQTASGRFTIVQLGRVVPVKNHEMAIKVAASVRQHIPDLRWLIVGRIGAEGSAYVRSCRKAVHAFGLEDTVFFTGEQSDIGAILRQAHVGVLTSHAEGLPVALLEYMAWGLPVVVTDVGACRQVVRASNGGFVVAPGDVGAFAEGLIQLGTDAQQAECYGQHNYDSAKRHYSARAMAERVMAVYETLLSI